MDLSTRRSHGAGRHGPGRPSQFSAPRELWEQHRGRIETLYWVEQRPLPQLMSIMEKEHGFCATAKMYKLRFKEWGLEKNIKSDEAKAMLTIRKRRREELNAETEFVLRGRVVTDVKLDRFQKRLKIDVGALATDASWDVKKMGLEYRTPRSAPSGEQDADCHESLASSLHYDGVDGSGQSTPRQTGLASPSPDPDAGDCASSSPVLCPTTPELSQNRLDIITNVFKQVKAISIDRTCHDIIGPAMAAGDDELARVLLRDETASSSVSLIKQHSLHLAVVHGRSSLVRYALEKGADVNSPPPGLPPALHQAVSHHQTGRILDILLRSNASLNATDKAGRTALGLAVSLGKPNLVRHLVQAGADLDYSVQPSLPPLYDAMLVSKHMEIYRFLKAQGALSCCPDSCRLEAIIREEWIPFSYTLLAHSSHSICKFNILQKACELSKVDDVASLLSDLTFLTPAQSRKILTLALANKYVDLAKLVISKDVGSLSEPVYNGKYALELAVEMGDTDLVSLVMSKSKPSQFPIALLIAVHHSNFAVADLLLNAGASQTDTLMQYPLTVATQNGDNDIVSLLLRHGADPNHQNQYGVRPLELAVDWGRDAAAEILIQSGAVPDANLLCSAIRNRLPRLARHLLAHCSADPSQICPDTGLSPLQEEASKRDPNYDLITLLLRFGADIYQTSPWQAPAPSPLLKAIRERNTLLVKCLLDNHKCSRLRCRRELPAALREADPLLLSDVQDSVAGHDSRLWRPGELDDMDMDAHLDTHVDLDAHGQGHTGMEDDMGTSTADTHGLGDHRHTHAHSLDSAAYAPHHGHYDPSQQHHAIHPSATAAQAVHGQGQHSSPQEQHSQQAGAPPRTPHPHDSTGSVYGFDQGHQNQPVIDFRTMTTIYPYWNPILLGMISPHGQH